MPLKLTTYYRGSEIPDLPGKNTFHSKELFLIYEATPGYKPVFIVATENGKPIAGYWPASVPIKSSFLLLSSAVVKYTARENTSRMKILTRKPYSAKCWSTSPQKFYETLL